MSAFAVRVALVGFGEVGQTLAADLQPRQGIEIRVWDRLFRIERSAPQRAVQAQKLLYESASMAEAVRGCNLVVSAVTAGECVSAASEAASSLVPGSYYLDLNSVAPETKREAARLIERAGALYVEAVVMSSIGAKRIASPMWLGGPHARAFLPLAQSLGLSGAAAYSDVLGDASAVKMCRSVVVKGMEALLTESLLTARYYGVEDAVLASLNDLLPASDWPVLARYMISRSLQHGHRRAEEMREVARTVTDAGLTPWMSLGCVERQEWAAQHAAALKQELLGKLLDAVRHSASAGKPASVRKASTA